MTRSQTSSVKSSPRNSKTKDSKSIVECKEEIKNEVENVQRKSIRSRRKSDVTKESKASKKIKQLVDAPPLPFQASSDQMTSWVGDSNGVIDHLPNEIWCLIFQKFVPIDDLTNAKAVCKRWKELIESKHFWRGLARYSLGDLIDKISFEPSDWHTYMRKRCFSKTFCDLSPLDLIQENYQKEPWKMLVALILSSRTKGGDKIKAIVKRVFDRYSDLSSLYNADLSELYEIITPLGLQLNRIKSIKAFAEDFITTDWTQPIECYGIGPLGNDSFHIFCDRKVKGTKSSDECVRSYQTWRTRNGCGCSKCVR